MRIIRLYVDLPLNAETRVELPEGAAYHLCKVLRAKVGYDISLFNGDGFDYSARVADIGKKSVWVEITGKTSGPAPSPVQVHIGQVISKGDRMDYMVQKATELGVTQITPLFSERCDVRLDEDRQGKRLQHWQQIALHACEQSGRTDIPVIQPAITLADWLTQRSEECRLVLHYENAQPLPSTPVPGSIALLIGPEGGLTNTELRLAHDQGFQTWALGPRILRTETAPVAALSVLQWIWGDFKDLRR